MKIVKLEATFSDVRYPVNGAQVMVEMDVFQIVESEIKEVPVGGFILDDREKETDTQTIIDYIYQLQLEGRPQDSKEFIYEPQVVSESKCKATKFLKQLRREILLDVII